MTTKQKSLLLLAKHGKFAVVETVVPKPGPGELLVEIHATALNPLEWKIQVFGLFVTTYPAVLGLDSAGIVKEVGDGVTEFVIGDRVLHKGAFSSRLATYQQYTVVSAELASKIPPNLTFDEASTVPTTLVTAAVGLYNKQGACGAGLTPVWEDGGRGKYAGQPIVVIGGSSSVGQYVIQLAKLSGFSPIITTASAHNETLLKSLGATHVLDRKNVPLSSLVSTVQSITSQPVQIVYDSISTRDTQNAAYDLLAPGGKIMFMLPATVEESKRTPDKEIVQVSANVYATEIRPLAVSLYKHLTALLAEGDIKPNKVEILSNGLNGIPAGLEKLRAGAVSATKLVAHPQETV